MTSLVEIKSCGEEKGRGYFATEDIESDVVVMEAEPYSWVVHDQWIKEACYNCMHFTPGKNMKLKCSKCMMTYFCSEKCQVENQKHHQHECLALLSLKSILKNPSYSHFSSDFRSLMRLLMSTFCRKNHEEAQTENLYGEEKVNGLTFADVQSLVSNESKMNLQGAYRESWREAHEVLNLALKGIRADWAISQQLVTQVMCIEECNSLGYWDQDRDMFGFAIVPLASYYNHSCEPNLIKSQRALKNIKTKPDKDLDINCWRSFAFTTCKPIQKGEELCICYTWKEDKVEERQKILLESFFFNCTCERCIRELSGS